MSARTGLPTATPFLAGGGEMGERMRAFDWSASPLGPAEAWPQSLRSPLSMLLPSKAQIILFWGPEFVVFYNDAYRPVFGAKHPAMLGQPGSVAWHEIWDTGVNLHGLLDGVVRTGEAFHARDLLFVIERNGFVEETYFDVSYDPVRDESGAVGGVFCIVTETTGRVVGERRLALLRDLAEAVANARTTGDACRLAMHAMAGRADLPFAQAWRGGQLVAATEGADAQVPPGPSRELQLPDGRLVVGISPQRPFDEAYASFLDLVAGQVATAITHARAYEDERRRAEALAEIDRAKTLFFTNVSHELRTPLSLVLGPIEDALGEPDATPALRGQLALAHRNSLRLLKLVNSLLDFARIEAGRAQMRLEPTDLARLTTELASVFRSAVERAGLALVIDCPPLPQPVAVDRDAWEKVVLNLLSNAFKYTFTGEIVVSLRAVDGNAELSVRDTGVGIPAAELPRIFERFHRVEGSVGRTQEGTGIGLALVQELARLHGGSIRAESAPGRGSTFTVSVPLARGPAATDGAGHARAEALPAHARVRSDAFVQEALRWLPVDDPATPAAPPVLDTDGELAGPHTAQTQGARIVLADDNADMRQYLQRLLSAWWRVELVADGQAALDAARRERPDLILSDVMMPRLDGFGLLAAVRAEPALADVPVILLSARAGEESRVEGIGRGADDYVVKPFAARELVARVGAHLALARVRRESAAALRESEGRYRALFENMGDGFCVVRMLYASEADRAAGERPVDYRIIAANPAFAEHTGLHGAVGRTVLEMVPDIEPRWIQTYGRVARTGEAERFDEHVAAWDRHFEVYAFRFGDATAREVAIFFKNVTERQRAADALNTARRRVDSALLVGEVTTYEWDVQADLVRADRNFGPIFGVTPSADGGTPVSAFLAVIHPDDLPDVTHKIERTLAGNAPFEAEYRIRHPGRGERWIDARGAVVTRDPHGAPRLWAGVLLDITDRKAAEAALRSSEQRFRTMADTAPAMLWVTDRDNMLEFISRGWFDYTGQDEAGAYRGGMGWTDMVHADDREAAARAFVDAAEQRQPFELQYRLHRADGSFRWAIDAGRPRFGEDGEWLGYIGSVIDVHARAMALEALREADRRKDEFLATLAHELRNPLAPIRNALHLLRVADSAVKAERLHEMLERQVGHLVRLVDDLMEASRISRGKLELQQEPLDLNDVLRHAVETSRPLMDRSRHRVEVSLPKEALPLSGDPVRLAQVFANLLNNAAKYTDDGGHVQVSAQRSGEWAVVTVRDSGVGLAPDQLPRVFEMFAQVDSTAARAHGGPGIGLALAQRLTEMHGGQIEVASDGLGSGSTFTVRLPLSMAGTPKPAEPAPSGMLNARRIMVVDDNEDAADSLGLLLRFLGAEVRVEHSGADALAAASAWLPSIVLLDLGMPHLDGFEVARRLRADPRLAGVKLIALTGWGQEDDRRRTREGGFDHHLIKPVDLNLLQALLMSMQDETRPQEEKRPR